MVLAVVRSDAPTITGTRPFDDADGGVDDGVELRLAQIGRLPRCCPAGRWRARRWTTSCSTRAASCHGVDTPAVATEWGDGIGDDAVDFGRRGHQGVLRVVGISGRGRRGGGRGRAGRSRRSWPGCAWVSASSRGPRGPVGSGSGAMVPAAMAASCSWAPRSISIASEQASSTLAPATTCPWWASRMAFLSPSAARDDLALFVADRNAGPVGQERAVVVERCDVHVRDDQRNFQHGQRRHVKRVGVHDAVARPAGLGRSSSGIGWRGWAFRHRRATWRSSSTSSRLPAVISSKPRPSRWV